MESRDKIRQQQTIYYHRRGAQKQGIRRQMVQPRNQDLRPAPLTLSDAAKTLLQANAIVTNDLPNAHHSTPVTDTQHSQTQTKRVEGARNAKEITVLVNLPRRQPTTDIYRHA